MNEFLNLLLFRYFFVFFFLLLKLHRNKQKPRITIWFYVSFIWYCVSWYAFVIFHVYCISICRCVWMLTWMVWFCASVTYYIQVLFFLSFFDKQKFRKIYGNPLKSVCDDKWNGKKIEETWAHLPFGAAHKARCHCVRRWNKRTKHCQDKMADCIELRKVRAGAQRMELDQQTTGQCLQPSLLVCVCMAFGQSIQKIFDSLNYIWPDYTSMYVACAMQYNLLNRG